MFLPQHWIKKLFQKGTQEIVYAEKILQTRSKLQKNNELLCFISFKLMLQAGSLRRCTCIALQSEK